jgi:ParB-like chromosome segregation protein Spo0J
MTRLKDLAEKTTDLFQVDPRKLKVREDWNVRQRTPDLEAHILSLMASIREIGVQEALTIIKDPADNLWVTNGHCRIEAVMRLIAEGVEIETVPCRPEDPYSNPGDHLLTMLVRNSGKPLDPIEKAEVCKRLHLYGWGTDKIAAKSGLTEPYVKDLLSLTAAPEPVQALVRNGKVSASTALDSVRKDGPSGAVEVLSAAVGAAEASGKKKATRRDVEPVREARAEQKAVESGVPLPKKINWAAHGPELRDLVLSIHSATGKEREKVIEQAFAYIEKKGLGEKMEAAS